MFALVVQRLSTIRSSGKSPLRSARYRSRKRDISRPTRPPLGSLDDAGLLFGGAPPLLERALLSASEQDRQPAKVRGVLEHDLDDDRQGYRQQHTHRTPNPSPENQRHEYDQHRKSEAPAHQRRLDQISKEHVDDEVAERYAGSTAGGTALFAAARLEANSGRTTRARTLFRKYIARYPKGQLHREARDRLDALENR